MRTTCLCSKSRAKVKTHTYMNACTSFQSVSLVQSVCYPSGLSSSLAPPPLDEDLPVSERLTQLKSCLSRSSVGHRGGVVVTYDIIQVYKMLVLSCGISLEGRCEDPKVRQIIFIHVHIKHTADSNPGSHEQAVTFNSIQLSLY